ncbi:efflux RND transporter permease subunit [Chitinispirillales bacterium ANBcel5]|uniref:efflux RND transporter permease subunit n=1 Tax=Cellulosispirillum alkaliphilum TaxID=3039283 RepID=UPI002A55EE51|nr:efflux RND transporter permease subunit [Chitinispirillales bacterium ANBcel5]
MNLSKFSVTRRVTISMLICIIILFGFISFNRLGLDMMPDLEFPIITISTSYEGAAAEDVEELVTRPIEQAVSSISGLEDLTSTSSGGLSVVRARFEWGTNLDFAGQDIRENIARITTFLPDDVSDPVVFKMDMSQFPIVLYGVSGMSNTSELRYYLENTVSPRLERLEGVAAVHVGGGLTREINVFLNKTRMDQYRVGTEAVIGALRAANLNVSSGHVDAGHQEFLVRTMGEFPDLESIGNTVITTINGAPLRINDIGRVEDTFEERRNYMRINGRDGVVLMITKQSGANTLDAVLNIREQLEEMSSIMPPDIEFMTIFDQGESIEIVTGNTAVSALIGALLAIFMLWLFLKNWRPTVVITIAIPISIVTTFIGMYAMGYTFNVITIGGFALAVGMLVDNAVVVIENIYRHLEEGLHRNDASITGANEVTMAITASTLTTVAVFIPLALSGGFAGRIAQPLALTVVAGLVASLFVAVTIIPMLASVLFKKRTRNVETVEAHGGKFFHSFQNKYENALGWALKHWYVVVIVLAGLMVASGITATTVGGEFMPSDDDGMGQVTINLPVGTNLQETNRLLSAIEEKALAIPEIEGVAAMVGRMGGRGGGPSDVNEGQLFFRLVPFSQRERSTEQVVNELRQSIPELNDVVIEFPEGNMMGGASHPIEIKFFGNDLEQLKQFADSTQALLSSMEGLHDVNISMREGKPELRIYPDRDRAALMGFSMAEIGTGIQQANLGQVASRFREAGEEYDIRIRLDEADRNTRQDIASIPIISREGIVTQVGNIGDIKIDRGPIAISRENRVRRVSVTANTTDRDIQSRVDEIRSEMAGMEASMPFGYFVEYGGSYQDMNDTFADLALAFLVAVILIYMVMAAQFESFSQPFIVMFTVPLSLIGVIFGLRIMGHPLSVPAFMGVIVLAGIVVNNGIVMITYINQLRERGMQKTDAIVKAAGIRLRPILITSLTTIFGILPMAVTQRQGSEMQGPMGTAVAFGLFSATFLTLFVVPVIYSGVDRFSKFLLKGVKRVVLGE